MSIHLQRTSTIPALELFPLIKQLNPTLSLDTFTEYYTRMQQQGYFLITAYEEKALVGVCGCWPLIKFWCGPHIEIDNVVVHQDYRNKGIGTALMDAVLHYATEQKLNAITLNAYTLNEDAHRFYDRYGFERPGVHRIKWLMN